MKKILYIALAAVLVVMGALIVNGCINAARHKNLENYYGCIDAGDYDGAALYAKKLKKESWAEDAEELRCIEELLEKGSYAEAMERYEASSWSESPVPRAEAIYCRCRYAMIVPAAEKALQDQDYASALSLLFDFQTTFHDGSGNTTVYNEALGHLQIGEYRSFSEFYPQEAQHFFDLFCTVGDAVLESGDAETCARLETILDDENPRTYPLKEFSWGEALQQWRADNKAAHQALIEADRERIVPVFDTALLHNWTPEALRAFGAEDITAFRPADPQPMYYIIVAEEPIDPLTGNISEGGLYDKSLGYKRVLNPASVRDLMEQAGCIEDSGLTLTDDPNKASFALLLSINYSVHTDSAGNDDGTVSFTAYHCTLHAELLNLLSGERLIGAEKTSDPFESVGNGSFDKREYVLADYVYEAEKAQMFCFIPTLSADDFSGYWSFVGQPEPVLSGGGFPSAAAPFAAHIV